MVLAAAASRPNSFILSGRIPVNRSFAADLTQRNVDAGVDVRHSPDDQHIF
jgi:hypothetical protein